MRLSGRATDGVSGRRLQKLYVIGLAIIAAWLGTAGRLRGDVPVITILADFEDDSVAAAISEVQGVLPSDCAVRRLPIPARGQACLALDIGATAADVSASCDLRFREPQRFAQADRVAAFCWIKSGKFPLAFRIRDARGQVFETAPQTVQTHNRWVRVVADLSPDQLRRIHGDGPLTWPIQIQGYRVTTDRLGKQTLYLDDLQVEHRVREREVIRGEFLFDEPTRIYAPGSTVGAAILLENCSRADALRVSVELAWTRPDGSVLKTQRDSVTLPPSGHDFRSRQSVDFSQRIDQPGLYRLVAHARATGWSAPNIFETSIAVTPSNRLLARGRATFFGVRADLMREPPADQWLEIAIARDIGVHILVVETPWRMIEPVTGNFDFTVLDPIISALVDQQIAPMIALSDPPDALPAGPARLSRLAGVLERLVRRYGPKVTHYQVDGGILPVEDLPALAGMLQQLQDGMQQLRPDVQLISPPLPLTTDRADPSWSDLLQSGRPWCFQSSGDCATAFAALRAFRESIGLRWQATHWWMHEAQPLTGPSFFVDAETVLRHYVRAARAGVGGVIWCELRDLDNDPANPDTMRGLVRRDFSPKASLLGYASAAGQLTGLACRGPVLGAPPEFESALFIGSDRHLAVLLPRPNRVRPALLAPLRGVPGEFAVRDFERRPRDLLDSPAGPLIQTLARPLFVSLMLESSQPEPQIGFADPWLRVPATVFVGADQHFAVEIDTVRPVRRGFVRLSVPAAAPFEAQPVRRSFQAEADQTLSFEFELIPRAGQPVIEGELTLKVSLDGRRIELPLEVRLLATIRPRPRGSAGFTDHQHQIGRPVEPEGQRASATCTVFAAYDADALHLAVAITDDRFVPSASATSDTPAGDNLLIGAALENADTHAEARLPISAGSPRLQPAHPTFADRIAGWRCDRLSSEQPDEQVYQLTIPAEALGAATLTAGARVLLAVRYTDDDADGLPPVALSWGRGLDGSRSSEGFHWCRLAAPPAP